MTLGSSPALRDKLIDKVKYGGDGLEKSTAVFGKATD